MSGTSERDNFRINNKVEEQTVTKQEYINNNIQNTESKIVITVEDYAEGKEEEKNIIESRNKKSNENYTDMKEEENNNIESKNTLKVEGHAETEKKEKKQILPIHTISTIIKDD